MKREGAGLTIAVLQQLKPGLNISGTDPSDDELKRAIQESLESGAYGVKLLGGHYPMTPDAMKRLIRICCDSYTFLAIHAGSTEHGSNLEGVREVIAAAEGRPLPISTHSAAAMSSRLRTKSGKPQTFSAVTLRLRPSPTSLLSTAAVPNAGMMSLRAVLRGHV